MPKNKEPVEAASGERMVLRARRIQPVPSAKPKAEPKAKPNKRGVKSVVKNQVAKKKKKEEKSEAGSDDPAPAENGDKTDEAPKPESATDENK
ncbi:high mobility group nucleosome-binding domain-containing protein 3 [Callorhinchus milii]|uniref:high mobility group nucleosome-binding domain-containing protein 3 n=1 Tax=Callorhinchus milii TaxID=7868 RepID=UPI001C3FCB69|nr:high mobility group nucleosome-binding domain-containing protein 3 [Callorhinchus milii]